MPEVIVDRVLAPFLVRLEECVCEELKRTVAGPVCRCSLVHSEVEILDGCDCVCDDGTTGRAYIRVVSEDSDAGLDGTSRPCPTSSTATVEIGVSRCVEDCSAELPPDAMLRTEVLKALSDKAALRRAVVCCARNQRLKPRWVGWRPLGPDGCCYGGALTIEVTIP